MTSSSSSSPPVRGPPAISARALNESVREYDSYEKRLRTGAAEPERFRGKYLDVNLAVRLMSRTQRRQALVCEMVVYLLLLSVFVSYLMIPSRYFTTFATPMALQQLLVDPPFSYLAPTYRSDNSPFLNRTGSGDCTLPYFFSETSFYPESKGGYNGSLPYTGCNLVQITKTFASIADFSGLWNWLYNLIVGTDERGTHLFPTGKGPNSTSGFLETDIPFLFPDGSYAPIGAVRMRQVRVKLVPCSDTNERSDAECVPALTPDTIDREPFVGAKTNTTYFYSTPQEAAAATVFNPETNQEINLSADHASVDDLINGVLGQYPYGGYIVDIPAANHTVAREILTRLLEDFWISRQTVAFVLSCSLYNINTGHQVVIIWNVEVSPFGPIAATFVVKPVPTPNSRKSASSAQFGLGVTVLVLSCLLLAYTLLALWRSSRTKHFSRLIFGWAMYDVFNLSVIIAGVSWRLALYNSALFRSATDPETLQLLSTTSRDVYVFAYTHLADQENRLEALNALSVIICFIKLFKYVDLNKRFSLPLNTLREARVWLVGWFAFFMVVLLAFSLYLFIGFGAQYPRYETFKRAFVSAMFYFFHIFAQFRFNSYENEVVDAGSTSSIVATMIALDDLRAGGGAGASVLGSSALFIFLFVVVALIVTTGLFQAIIIHGYQRMLLDVKEDEDLRREQRELWTRKQRQMQLSWIKRQVSYMRGLLRLRERERIVSRLITAPERRFRSLLSYNEVLGLLENDAVSADRAEQATEELMLLYEVNVSRMRDAVALFHEKKIAIYENQDLDAVIKDQQLPLIMAGQAASFHHLEGEDDQAVAASAAAGRLIKFDPLAKDRWIRDLQSGDTLQSFFLVHSLQMEASVRLFDQKLREIEALQRKIEVKQAELEKSVQRLENSTRHKRGDDTRVSETDPWTARTASSVEARVDGRFDAHHVDARSGEHRYLGPFDTAKLAQAAIQAINDQVLKQRAEESIARARSNDGLMFNSFFKAISSSGNKRNNPSSGLSEVTSVMSEQSDFFPGASQDTDDDDDGEEEEQQQQ